MAAKRRVPNKTVELDSRTIQEADAKATKRLEWLIGFMVVSYQFVYQILGLTVKAKSRQIPTMGVRVLGNSRFELLYNPDFVNSLPDDQLTYVLYHEVMHLALHHCTRRRFSNVHIGNIATDLAVNELIPVRGGSCTPPMKDGKLIGMHVSEFMKVPEYKDIRTMQSAEWYYDFLMKNTKEESKRGKGEGKGDGTDMESKEGEGKGDGTDMDDHGGWAEDELADEKVTTVVKEVNSSEQWGTISAEAKILIMAAQVHRINWRNLLRQHYGPYIWNDRETTRKRPNRRTGFINPGNRKILVDRHLIAIDTSGSTQELLPKFLAVINTMVDQLLFDIVECDTEIKDKPRPYERCKKEIEFTGLGGTSFDPIMKLVDERHYKTVVILTDGAAAECPKPKAEVIWVLPHDMNPPVDWGKRVHIDNH